jgi:hypothetical protein
MAEPCRDLLSIDPTDADILRSRPGQDRGIREAMPRVFPDSRGVNAYNRVMARYDQDSARLQQISRRAAGSLLESLREMG